MKDQLSRLKSFLNRDVTSFFTSSPKIEDNSPPLIEPQTGDSEVDSATSAPATIEPLPLLLNPAALEQIAFRSEILDWRDQAIVSLYQSANTSLSGFRTYIDSQLEDVSIWRRALPKPANRALSEPFNKLVRDSIRREMDLKTKNLMAIWSKRKVSDGSEFRIYDRWPDSQLSYLAKIGFKPDKRQLIFDRITDLVLGDHGISDMFSQQIIRISARIIDERPV